MANKSSVVENTREQILSSDLNRMQRLTDREWLNLSYDQGRTDNDRSLTTGLARLTQGSNGEARSYFQKVPTIAKSGASMAITIGAGEALENIGTPVNPDDPNYSTHRWPDTILTPAVGNGANPRIDLIVSTAAEQSTDAQTRNVLQDPSTGVVAPETVYKTLNPLSTLAVIAGTPAAAPVPPIPPPTALVLYEVLVPTASTLATQASLTRQLQRQSVYVGTSAHGILEGCSPIFGSVTTGGPLETAAADVKLDDVGVNRVVIDGEVLVFAGGVTTGLLPKIIQDTGAANPFGVAAATADRAYFIYVVGGIWFNTRSLDNGGGNNGFDSVVLVESLTPPMIDGRPTAPINTPWGNTVQGALYIGLGYTVFGTTFRKRVFWENDYCWARGGLDNETTTHPAGTLAFNEGAAVGLTTNIFPAAATVVTVGSQPNGGAGQGYRKGKFRAVWNMLEPIPIAGSGLRGQIFLGPAANGDILMNLAGINNTASGVFGVSGEDMFDAWDIPISVTRMSQKMVAPAVAGNQLIVNVHAVAWKMNVNHIGSHK
jgi:hypothetical protein